VWCGFFFFVVVVGVVVGRFIGVGCWCWVCSEFAFCRFGGFGFYCGLAFWLCVSVGVAPCLFNEVGDLVLWDWLCCGVVLV